MLGPKTRPLLQRTHIHNVVTVIGMTGVCVPGCLITIDGLCFPGSDDPGTLSSQACSFACLPPNAFVWGEQTLQFFLDHPRRKLSLDCGW